MSFTVEINNAQVLDALNRLLLAGQDMNPVLLAIGEGITKRAKERFDTLAAPDGTPWAPNAPSTIDAYVSEKGGYSKKTGKLLKKGALMQISKKPLQGHSGDLARQISSDVLGNVLTVGAGPKYAAMQQFGGKKSEFPNLWGDIPARPFLPVTRDEQLYPEEERSILDALNKYFSQSFA